MKKLLIKIMAVLVLLSVILTSAGAADNYSDAFNNSEQDVQEKEYKQKFWDVSQSHWAFEAIAELTDRGAISGYPNGSFKPENTVTRAEWAKIMIEAAGLTANDYSVRFADMKGHWAAAYVNAASEYLTAFSDSRYRPDQAVTREDVTMAMVKLKGYDLGEVDYSILSRFKDVASISNSMKVYVAMAVEKGLINGFNDGTFRGQATLTRAQAATLLWRAFQYGNDNKTTAGAQEYTESGSIYGGENSENYSGENGTAITVNNLEGMYWDVESQRAHMDIKKKNDAYKIYIGWGSSAWETTNWFFDAKIDTATGNLVYESGYEFNVIYKDDGTESWNLINDKCTGNFEFEGAFLIWNDYSEDTSGKCKFQKGEGYLDEDYSFQYEAATSQLEKYVSSCMNNEIHEKKSEKEERLADQYNLTLGLLLDCFGYSDSDELIKKLISVNDIAIKLPESISITKDKFKNTGYSASMRDTKCFVEYKDKSSGSAMSMTFTYDKTKFTADFTNVWGYSLDKIPVQFIVSLFAENYKDAEFARLLGESYNKAGGGNSTTFSLYYGGYNIEIEVESAGYSKMDISVNGEKGEKKDSDKTSNKESSMQTSQKITDSASNTNSANKTDVSSKKYHYKSYYAEYIVDANNTGSINTYSREAVMQHIEREGATLVGEIKVYEKILYEYKGEFFEDNETGLYYYLED